MEKKISPSELNEFASCPKMWQLHHKIGARIPVDIEALDLGQYVHECIAQYLKLIGNSPSLSQITNIVNTVFEENFPRYVIGNMKDRIDKIKKNFIWFEEQRSKNWKGYKPLFVEEKLQNNNYSTIVDFYSSSDNILIDWKTGHKDSLTDNDLRQGKIMEIVLRDHGFKVDKILFIALLPCRVFELPKITDGFVENECRKMQEAIKINLFPKRGHYCHNCDVQLSCQFEEECLWLL